MPVTTLEQWIRTCTKVTHTPATFYAGARKIIKPYGFTFSSLDDSIELRHSGFTTNKLRMLVKNYLHEESRKVAVELWEKRRGQENYGSVGFTCYNHFVKGDVAGATPRGSKFGPCVQSVVITQINKRTYSIDVFYRTTELLKKFAPDVVLLRDILLEPFDFDGMECQGITFHFANLTCHSMYLATIFPLVKHPLAMLEDIKRNDKYFYNWAVKWSARYICPKYEHGIQKFAQALRVQKDVLERLDKSTLRDLQKYLVKNHPGYTRTRFDHGEEEDAE